MLMAAQRISGRELSEKTGLSVTTLSRITAGRRVIDIDQMRAISDALNIDIQALVLGVIPDE